MKHLTVATVRGAFARFEGWLETDETGVTAATGAVESASVTTGDAKRDATLLGPGFLDATCYPMISLSAHGFQARGGATQIVADLTMKGVTRRIRLTASSAGFENGSGAPGRLRIVASGAISRGEFGVTGNGILESAGAVVSDTVKVTLDVSAIRQPELPEMQP